MDDIWFRMPPGFVDVDVAELEDWGTRVLTELPSLFGDAAQCTERMRETQALLGVLSCLGDQGTMHAAFGVHTNADSDVCLSLLTFTDIDTGSPNPTVAAAHCALRMAADGMGELRTKNLVALPCARPAVLATYHLGEPPEQLLQAAGLSTAGRAVFQARLSIARPQGSRMVVVDLTTTELSLADEYTDILLGIGHTVSFVDPQPEELPARPSRLLDVLL
ncbi:hypothetical protein [Streptomyces purpureus]|uniref:Uncharacterized protein n=1 Tax=Streptomyces purpureus TaxID=1951 RepID=A0A918HHW3_9ACTN|nr:hypothetical protein [Streptomyces purpureus]GGT63397.1 hypothetical protein GCM10014713_65850 [Streptomyces purpureus]